MDWQPGSQTCDELRMTQNDPMPTDPVAAAKESLWRLQIVGCAIVSADDMIANASGQMPPSLIHEADQRFFAQELDAAHVIVHGRRSQEPHVDAPRRRRLVVTRRVPALAPHPNNPNALLWNPAGAAIEEACTEIGVGRGTVAVIGGMEVFGLFLPRYTAFHLTRAGRIRLPGGRPVFPGIPPANAEELLATNGLRLFRSRVLDEIAELTLHTWCR